MDGLAVLEESDPVRLLLHQAVFRKADEIQAKHRQDLAVRISNSVWERIKFK